MAHLFTEANQYNVHISQWDDGHIACSDVMFDSIGLLDLKTRQWRHTTLWQLILEWLGPHLKQTQLDVIQKAYWKGYKLPNGNVVVWGREKLYFWDCKKLHTFTAVNVWVFLPTILCFEMNDRLEIWNMDPLYRIIEVNGPVKSVKMLPNHRILMKQWNEYEGRHFMPRPAEWQLIDLVQKTTETRKGSHFTMLASGYTVTCERCTIWVQFIPFVGMARMIDKPVIECTPLQGSHRFLTKSDDNSVYLWDINVYLAERELHPLWHSSHIVFHKRLGHFTYIKELNDGKFVGVEHGAMQILSSEGQCENQVQMEGCKVTHLLPLQNGQILTQFNGGFDVWDMYCWSKNQMEEFEHKINEYLDPVMKDVRPIVRLYLA
jgi:hypothetical protein